ncbi:hypothetical protein ACP3VQ_15330 [Metapseudomonas otitidis]|uniref:hypothetical protein n=1 Tax=Metapseudomonas otitidis TaxID=319939 RepID=UPI003CF65BB8
MKPRNPIALLALLWASSPAFALDAQVVGALEKALTCQQAPLDARDDAVKALFKANGIVAVDYDEDGLIDLEYHLPQPVEVLGVPISTLWYRGDSGAVFYAQATGDLAAFVGRTGVQPVPKDELDTSGWGRGQYRKEVGQASDDIPFPDAFFVGTDSASPPGTFYFGCQVFDG